MMLLQQQRLLRLALQITHVVDDSHVVILSLSLQNNQQYS